MAVSPTAILEPVSDRHVAMFEQEINRQTYWIGCTVDGPRVHAITPLSVNKTIVERVSSLFAQMNDLPWNAQARWGNEKIVTVVQSDGPYYVKTVWMSRLAHLKDDFESIRLDDDVFNTEHSATLFAMALAEYHSLSFWEFSHLNIHLDRDWPQPEDPSKWAKTMQLPLFKFAEVISDVNSQKTPAKRTDHDPFLPATIIESETLPGLFEKLLINREQDTLGAGIIKSVTGSFDEM